MHHHPERFLAIAILMSITAAACGGSPTSPSSVPGSSSTGPSIVGTGVTSYTYTNDVRAILTDCTSCHNASQRQAGFDFTSYAGVLRAVTVGSPSSLLLQVVQPGGAMNGALTGDRTHKIQVLYDWIVNSNAAQ
jgi:cytochrome c553